MPTGSNLQVFLCHAREDKDAVRELYQWLKSTGHRPWLDEVSIPPGKNWLLAIRQAIRESNVILVCLSSRSIRKRGVVQREIKLALEAAMERPEDEIFVIPCRLEECDVPIGLQHWQWVDLFNREGHDKLATSLKLCAAAIAPTGGNNVGHEEQSPEALNVPDDNVGEAFDFILHCAGTAARNTVHKILEGYAMRKDRTDQENRVKWLVDSIEESSSRLSNVSAPDGNDFIATRLKGAAMGASFAGTSFTMVVSQVQEFFALESSTENREEYVLDRLQKILDEWEDYNVDEWASRQG